MNRLFQDASNRTAPRRHTESKRYFPGNACPNSFFTANFEYYSLFLSISNIMLVFSTISGAFLKKTVQIGKNYPQSSLAKSLQICYYISPPYESNASFVTLCINAFAAPCVLRSALMRSASKCRNQAGDDRYQA